ncbi:MAG: TraB/GumN family protein [Bacteroidetes bacterium]|nr:TraB/GumN family protein [Bacteroidota bacterium]MBS1973395.1 TraB/GumN family protein [Bacteroidota bacterium]
MIAQNSIKKILLVFVYVFLTGVAIAQSALPKLPNTLLWQVTGKDLKRPTYIFGTMHILCADDAVLGAGLESAIKNCDEIYFEIDMSDMMAMLNAMKYMTMNGDKKLSDLLSTEDYSKVKNYFSEHQSLMPFSMLERYKPMLIGSLIEEQNLPCKTTNGMELVIMKEARRLNKKINGLETAVFQASLFDSIPYKDQALELVKYIDSSNEFRKMTDTLAQAYKEQDLNKIEELSTKEDPASSHYMDLLLYGRNLNWAWQLQRLMREKSLLVAVGAGHLPGEKGLLSLLRKNGYVITPITIGEK